MANLNTFLSFTEQNVLITRKTLHFYCGTCIYYSIRNAVHLFDKRSFLDQFLLDRGLGDQ